MEHFSDSSLVNLILALFRYTALDIKFGKKELRNDALDFLNSEWFEWLCEPFETDPNRIRHMIINNKLSWRKKYE